MDFSLPVVYQELTQLERKHVREQYGRKQGGLCHHCKQPLLGQPSKDVLDKHINLSLFPPNFLKNLIHLHHHHGTGLTLGSVHARCNAVLWQYLGE